MLKAFAARRTHPVVTTRTSANLLPPFEQKSLRYKAMQNRIDTPLAELERSLGTRLDLGNQLVTVHFFPCEKLQNQQLWHTVEEMLFDFHTATHTRELEVSQAYWCEVSHSDTRSRTISRNNLAFYNGASV